MNGPGWEHGYVIPLHLGELHAYEQWLAIGLAFGPFLVLAVVIAVRRRQSSESADLHAENTPSRRVCTLEESRPADSA